MDAVRVCRSDKALHVSLRKVDQIVQIVIETGRERIDPMPFRKVEADGLIIPDVGVQMCRQMLFTLLTPSGDDGMESFTDQQPGQANAKVAAPTENQNATTGKHQPHSLRVPPATVKGPS